MADTCNWPGASGRSYLYHVYLFGTALKPEAGNYIYAKLNSQNQWVPLYIGETDDLQERVATHEKRECVKQNGVILHTSTHTSRRRIVKSDWQKRRT